MSNRNVIILKVVVWVICLLPLANLVYGGLTHHLGANPIERITNETGEKTLVFLMISLGITPVRRLTGMNWLIRFRRLLGLFAFFFGSLHLMTYMWLDKFFDFGDMLHDITKRPFIWMGLTAFTLMVPLAATSTAWSIRKMGGRNWNLLHKLAYASAISGVIHFWWKQKKDVTEPQLYAIVLAVLLLIRILWWAKEKWWKKPEVAAA